MKKYLMTGIAAVAMCAAFTSCSHDVEPVTQEQLDQLEAEKVFKNYEKAFIATFGQPAANQTWGFSGAGFTRSENANANEWADPTKEYGGLKVPPALTTEQIAVVREYFQTHPNLGYEDPQWSNYFIQQVYKGHTNVPEGCATPEAYLAANQQTYIIASDHMDHLIAIDEQKGIVDHINNFNHGDCGLNEKVLTWSPDYVSSANDGPFHSDKIMYMKNSTTKSFGYANSNGSVVRTNYTGLVSYKTIMQAMGTKANCLNDGWNRSFMGFDFEQMVDDECYAAENGTFKNMIIQGEYYINGVKQNNYVYQYNGQPVKMLSDQTNRYCGTLRTVSDSDLYSDLRDANNNNAYLGKQLNTSVIDGLLAEGYLPVDNKGLREWIKVGGCADGYFSDWIVTLTKAEQDIHIPEGTTLRVMAEDLSANQASDFDFNDVVLDFVANENGTAATIYLQAAGGTLPLRINENDAWEVHKLFGVATNVMVNTGAEEKGLNGDTKPTVTVGTVTGDFSAANFRQAVNNVKIEVQKNGQWMELRAKQGEAACKFGTDPANKWVPELENIDGYYNFSDWVQGFTATLTAKKTW